MRKKRTQLQILRSECDTLFQKIGLLGETECEVCGSYPQVIHHFFPKSISAYLRYDFRNAIILNNGCHFGHHKREDPRIHVTVIKNRGMDWYDDLVEDSTKKIKVNTQYYKDKLEDLTKIYEQKSL